MHTQQLLVALVAYLQVALAQNNTAQANSTAPTTAPATATLTYDCCEGYQWDTYLKKCLPAPGTTHAECRCGANATCIYDTYQCKPVNVYPQPPVPAPPVVPSPSPQPPSSYACCEGHVWDATAKSCVAKPGSTVPPCVCPTGQECIMETKQCKPVNLYPQPPVPAPPVVPSPSPQPPSSYSCCEGHVWDAVSKTCVAKPGSTVPPCTCPSGQECIKETKQCKPVNLYPQPPAPKPPVAPSPQPQPQPPSSYACCEGHVWDAAIKSCIAKPGSTVPPCTCHSGQECIKETKQCKPVTPAPRSTDQYGTTSTSEGSHWFVAGSIVTLASSVWALLVLV